MLARYTATRQTPYTKKSIRYLEGIDRFPGDPFLKFRLVDLCLITFQLDRARQLLASLRASYPFALEMMFALPAPADAVGPKNVLPHLTAAEADFVWLVAADPVYAERVALLTVLEQAQASETFRFDK